MWIGQRVRMIIIAERPGSRAMSLGMKRKQALHPGSPGFRTGENEKRDLRLFKDSVGHVAHFFRMQNSSQFAEFYMTDSSIHSVELLQWDQFLIGDNSWRTEIWLFISLFRLRSERFFRTPCRLWYTQTLRHCFAYAAPMRDALKLFFCLRPRGTKVLKLFFLSQPTWGEGFKLFFYLHPT